MIDHNSPLFKPDLSNLIDAHISGTHGVLSDGCKDFCPKIIVQAIDPLKGDAPEVEYICIIVDQDFNEPEEKHGIMEKLGREFYHNQKLPLSVSMTSEAWLSHQLDVRPSESDDRKEVIVLAAMGIDGSTEFQVMPFKRDKTGSIIEGPFIRHSGGVAQCDLLQSFYAGFWGEYEKKEKGMRR